MKCLPRIELNAPSRTLETIEEKLHTLSRRSRAQSNTEVLLRLDRIEPMLLGAVNSVGSEQRNSSTKMGLSDLVEIAAHLQRSKADASKETTQQG